jgi:hypothetical protein
VDAAVRGHGASKGQSKELHECPLTRLLATFRTIFTHAERGKAAGGAGGLFSTVQQLGGALGVAVIGTIFFGQLGTHSFTQAFTSGLPVAAGLFLASVALALLLPKTAVADEHG